jgi:xanthine dehydrogenase large subunit
MRPDSPRSPTTDAESPLGRPLLHESGLRHATGEARYVDDLPRVPGALFARVFPSTVAHGHVRALDIEAARRVPGVHAVLTAADIPGLNDIAPLGHDEELLAREVVHFVGQPIALVVGDDDAACRRGLAAIHCTIEPRPAIVTLEAAIAAGSYLTEERRLQRGDVDRALLDAPVVVSGTLTTGGQDHFYLETHAALATPAEDGGVTIASSTQHPSEVQAKVAEILGLHRHQVVVETVRMGGGFGGKETQAAHWAAMAALAAHHTGRPVRAWLNRDEDMTMTGKRHPFTSRYRAGFDRDGQLLGLDVETVSDGGFSLDLSRSILDRCLFHLDNAYHVPNARLRGRVARTNTPSNTAFRGFGGPQGVAVIEAIMDQAARALGLTGDAIRARNYYRPGADETPYGQRVDDPRSPRIHAELVERSALEARRAAIAAWNARQRFVKRGLALTPVKFGISFTASHLNQAGALVHVYADGTVQLTHGGTEMGQGLHTKMVAIAAHVLGVPLDRVRLMPTTTDKVPNTSATAASSGADLNGAAVRAACETLRERLAGVARAQLKLAADAPLRFAGGAAIAEDGRAIGFAALCQAAYMAQISLSATGFYRTPDIGWDPATGKGRPFHYYAFGAAVAEVEVSGLTGEHRVRRVDVVHDVGDSLVPSIDRGQIEGGLVQGIGWLTREELVTDARGVLRTHSPDTYKIPSAGDAPSELYVHLLEAATQPDVVMGSKAVGEPPLMLAFSVVSALREAIAAFAPGTVAPEDVVVPLRLPATPEAVLDAIDEVRGGPARLTAADVPAADL